MRKKLLFLPIMCALTVLICGPGRANDTSMPATGVTLPPYPWEGNLCAVVDGTFPYFHFVWC